MLNEQTFYVKELGKFIKRTEMIAYRKKQLDQKEELDQKVKPIKTVKKETFQDVTSNFEGLTGTALRWAKIKFLQNLGEKVDGKTKNETLDILLNNNKK